jgi:hypothetical protein
MPHWDEPGFQQIVCPWIDIAGSAGRQMEGFLDVAHFAFIHAESFADPDNAQVPDYRPRRTAQGFEAEYWSNVANYPKGVDKAPPGFRWLRHFRCHVPFTATLEVHFPGEDRLVILNAASPVSAGKPACSCRSHGISTPTSRSRASTISTARSSRKTAPWWRRNGPPPCRWNPPPKRTLPPT